MSHVHRPLHWRVALRRLPNATKETMPASQWIEVLPHWQSNHSHRETREEGPSRRNSNKSNTRQVDHDAVVLSSSACNQSCRPSTAQLEQAVDSSFPLGVLNTRMTTALSLASPSSLSTHPTHRPCTISSINQTPSHNTTPHSTPSPTSPASGRRAIDNAAWALVHIIRPAIGWGCQPVYLASQSSLSK